ncbi:MlaA family lipoprotein [Salibaculum griseiflavum]|uniref:VacJ like lipoprotein n=1 Tax=Salibaculum griseiflavum TaxID=1914409 RepID=A0A2V1P7K8_9RHOB|nr:VacJ family lipoprotein [Salibaculum griseiflavum]PWG18479.1 VacJ like lipoprotein [Salibaculum griseiflavum]
MPLPFGIRKALSTACAIFALGAVAACTPAPPGGGLDDPYEATNRDVHEFNKSLDRAVLRPLGQVAAATPREFTGPVSNFADNTGLPGMVLNGMLQGDIGGAATNTMRFLLNTTIGVGGLLDPAGGIGLYEESTDFGETLAVWGVQEGAFIELPVLGPSTERDAAGQIVDFVLDPLARVGTRPQIEYGLAARGARIVIDRGQFMQTVDGLLYDSADSYSQARSAYLQNRRFDLGEAPPVEETVIDPFALDLEGFE